MLDFTEVVDGDIPIPHLYYMRRGLEFLAHMASNIFRGVSLPLN